MASRMTAQHVQKLRDELSRVEGEIRALQGRRDGLLMAIAVVNDEPVADTIKPPQPAASRTRLGVKDDVLRLLGEAGEQGANALEIVEMAKAQGRHLDRNSISSLLSRFKRDGIVQHDGKRYRIPRPPLREVKMA